MAPHRLPLTQVTSCMRVSLLSRFADFSANGSLMPSRTCEHELLFKQVLRGWLPDFCTAEGGSVYWPTLTLLTLSTAAGEPLFSELVLLRDQTRSCVDGSNDDRPL